MGSTLKRMGGMAPRTSSTTPSKVRLRTGADTKTVAPTPVRKASAARASRGCRRVNSATDWK